MNPETEGRAAAEEFREEHRLGGQPLGDVIAVIEHVTGIDVAVLDAGPDEHGLAMRDPVRGRVFIGVARTRHPMRQRSSLAHELGHVVFADWNGASAANLGDRTPAEQRADSFARHLLIPQAGVVDFLTTDVTLAHLSAVVQRFLVSPSIAAIALHQAGCIDRSTKQEWMALSTPQLAVRFGWSDQYHSLQVDSDQRRAPQRLLARAIAGYVEGVLPVETIATLRGMTVADTEAELRAAGIVPQAHPVAWMDPAALPDVDVDLSALDEDPPAPTGGTPQGQQPGDAG